MESTDRANVIGIDQSLGYGPVSRVDAVLCCSQAGDGIFRFYILHREDLESLTGHKQCCPITRGEKIIYGDLTQNHVDGDRLGACWLELINDVKAHSDADDEGGLDNAYVNDLVQEFLANNGEEGYQFILSMMSCEYAVDAVDAGVSVFSTVGDFAQALNRTYVKVPKRGEVQHSPEEFMPPTYREYCDNQGIYCQQHEASSLRGASHQALKSLMFSCGLIGVDLGMGTLIKFGFLPAAPVLSLLVLGGLFGRSIGVFVVSSVDFLFQDRRASVASFDLYAKAKDSFYWGCLLMCVPVASYGLLYGLAAAAACAQAVIPLVMGAFMAAVMFHGVCYYCRGALFNEDDQSVVGALSNRSAMHSGGSSFVSDAWVGGDRHALVPVM